MSIICVIFHTILGGPYDGSVIDPRVLRIVSFVKNLTLTTINIKCYYYWSILLMVMVSLNLLLIVVLYGCAVIFDNDDSGKLAIFSILSGALTIYIYRDSRRFTGTTEQTGSLEKHRIQISFVYIFLHHASLCLL